MESQTAHLSKVLKTAIGVLGLTQREVEDRMRVSQGYLSRLFGGQIDLKVDHVEQIAQALEVEPEELFRMAYPPSQDEPSPRASRLRQAFGITSPPPSGPPSGIEKEIERMVRRVLAESRETRGGSGV